MEFSANSCLEICKSSVGLIIKIQQIKDQEPRGSSPSSLKLQSLTVSAAPGILSPEAPRNPEVRALLGNVAVSPGDSNGECELEIKHGDQAQGRGMGGRSHSRCVQP
jgi:hypothetical protein